MLPRYSSICIPRVDATITSSYIYNKISNLNIGDIERMNEIPLRNDPAYKRVIITMKWDTQSEVAKYIQNKFKKSEKRYNGIERFDAIKLLIEAGDVSFLNLRSF